MTFITANTFVEGAEEVKETQVKRTGKRFFFFKTEWWETVSTESIGNDIYIATTKPIRNIYLNGEITHPK